jgi:hypothetical protein
VNEEVHRMAWGKQESRGAVWAGPVLLWAQGVGRKDSQNAVRRDSARNGAVGVRKIGPIRGSEESGRRRSNALPRDRSGHDDHD